MSSLNPAAAPPTHGARLVNTSLASSPALSKWHSSDLLVSKAAIAAFGIITALATAHGFPLACATYYATRGLVFSLRNPSHIKASDTLKRVLHHHKISTLILPKIIALGMVIGSAVYAITSRTNNPLSLLGCLAYSGLSLLATRVDKKCSFSPQEKALFSQIYSIANRTRDPNTEELPQKVLYQVQGYFIAARKKLPTFSYLIDNPTLSYLESAIEQKPEILKNPEDVAELLRIYRVCPTRIAMSNLPIQPQLWPYLFPLLNKICSDTRGLVPNTAYGLPIDNLHQRTLGFISPESTSAFIKLTDLMQFGFFIQKQKHPEDPIFQELQTNFSLIEGAIKRAAILGRGLIDAINSSSQLSYDQQKELRKLVEKLENSLKPQDCHLRFDGMIV